MPAVSVIIPAINEADRIQQSIERAWSAGAAEVIVVDGGSTDATCRLAESSRCRLVFSEAGRARQQNAGAATALGAVLLFLHADCWLAPNAISQVADALDDPRVEWGAFRQRIESPGFLYRLLEWGNALRIRCWGIPYGDQGIFIRATTFRALNGFPVVPLLEDVMLAQALGSRTAPALLPGPLTVSARRWQRYGVLRQTVRNWGILLAWKRGRDLDELAREYRRHDQVTFVDRIRE